MNKKLICAPIRWVMISLDFTWRNQFSRAQEHEKAERKITFVYTYGVSYWDATTKHSLCLKFCAPFRCALVAIATKGPEWPFRQLLKPKDPFLKAETIDFYTYFCFAMDIHQRQKDSHLLSPSHSGNDWIVLVLYSLEKSHNNKTFQLYAKGEAFHLKFFFNGKKKTKHMGWQL